MRKIGKKQRTVSVILSEDDYIGLETMMFQYKRRSMSAFIRDIIRTMFMHNMFGKGYEKVFEDVGIDMTKKWDDQNPESV